MRYAGWVVMMALTGNVAAGQALPADTSFLESLTVGQAKSLARRDEFLNLRSLKALPIEVAKTLAQHRGNVASKGLNLESLTRISDEAAKAILPLSGDFLCLEGLTTLSTETAKTLAQHKGHLDLGGLSTLTAEAAKALATHKGSLILSGLTTLSDEAAKALARHDGDITLSRAVEEKYSKAKQSQEEADEALAVEQREKEKAALAAVAAERRKISLPQWEGYEDLRQSLQPFQRNRNSSLDSFVRFGTPELAEKALRGDRFAREEADEAATGHRAGLGRRHFLWQAAYNWDEREPIAGKEDTVRLRVPLNFRCFVPAHDAQVGVAAYNDRTLWFLTKEGSLKQCLNASEVRRVVAAQGVLYAPELLAKSELVLWVYGDREVRKAVAREPTAHIVNIGLTNLRVEHPSTQGFYKLEAIEAEDYTSGSLLVSYENGNNGSEEQPDYFVTQEWDPTDDRSMPEVVAADVDKVEVVNVAGENRRVVFTWSRK